MLKRIWDVTLTVTNLAVATEFYEKVLGLSKKYEFTDYAGFDCGGVEIGLKTWGGIDMTRKGEPCVTFLVDDVEQTYQDLLLKNVNLLGEPSDTVWGGRVLMLQDPDGNTIQLVQIDWQRYFSTCVQV